MHNLIALMIPALAPLALLSIILPAGLIALARRKTAPDQRDLSTLHQPRRKTPGTFQFELNGPSLAGVCIILLLMLIIGAGNAVLDLAENEPVSITAAVDMAWYENGRGSDWFPTWYLSISAADGRRLALRAAPPYVGAFPVKAGETYVFQYYPRTQALCSVAPLP